MRVENTAPRRPPATADEHVKRNRVFRHDASFSCSPVAFTVSTPTTRRRRHPLLICFSCWFTLCSAVVAAMDDEAARVVSVFIGDGDDAAADGRLCRELNGDDDDFDVAPAA
ncbi:hypothetical protein OPV22_016961 [Ensete ventricosum]|uniref:Uncharacterized protein n=1 Tax=Ensete ventricosum TaxID=4639 RepID=A0AAV8PHB9_ENSVE|nr:hypothetical protein OPV22_016961 [Ensete ventricosum]